MICSKIVILALFLIALPIMAVQGGSFGKSLSPLANAGNTTSEKLSAAKCYDYRLANYINTGLQFYSHDMGQLAKYILDQIVRARLAGYWLVNAEMIGQRRQGLDWQTLTTGDLFAPTSSHGCYYHDTQTYIVILRY